MPWVKRKSSFVKRIHKGIGSYRFRGKTKLAKRLLRIRLMLIGLTVLLIIGIALVINFISTS